jgi:toxin CcdB
MAQFDVYVNNDLDSQKLYPYLIDVQTDLLGHLPTHVVIPLLHSSNIKKPIPILNPIFKISDTLVYMSTPQLVGISGNLLSSKVCSLAENRSEIIAALDLLFNGF